MQPRSFRGDGKEIYDSVSGEPDQARLRKEVIELAEYLSCTADELWNELKPIIAREVRLTQDSEQNKLFAILRHLDIKHDAKEIMRVRKEWDRIAELSKEDAPND